MRRDVFRPFQVTADLIAEAAADALFMHCLPAHRGEEVAAEVIDDPNSVVWMKLAIDCTRKKLCSNSCSVIRHEQVCSRAGIAMHFSTAPVEESFDSVRSGR